MYTPVAPSGLHQAPGYTETPTGAGDVAVGEVAVGEVAVVFGTVAVGEVAVVFGTVA